MALSSAELGLVIGIPVALVVFFALLYALRNWRRRVRHNRLHRRRSTDGDNQSEDLDGPGQLYEIAYARRALAARMSDTGATACTARDKLVGALNAWNPDDDSRQTLDRIYWMAKDLEEA